MIFNKKVFLISVFLCAIVLFSTCVYASEMPEEYEEIFEGSLEGFEIASNASIDDLLDDISEDEFKSMCEEISFDDWNSNPMYYAGDRIKVTAKIVNISYEDEYDSYEVYLEMENQSDNIIYADIYDMKVNATEDDSITVYGYGAGYYYDFMEEKEYPQLYVQYVEE